MANTTTIEIKSDQKQQLDELKHGDESYKSILQAIIEDYRSNSQSLDETRVRELAREVVRDKVVMEALE